MRHVELRDRVSALGQSERNDVIQRAIYEPVNVELFAALYYANPAFPLISDRTKTVVSEVYARATNLDAYETLLINEQQLAAAQEGIQRAREIVARVVGWAPDDYVPGDAEATRRAQMGGREHPASDV